MLHLVKMLNFFLVLHHLTYSVPYLLFFHVFVHYIYLGDRTSVAKIYEEVIHLSLIFLKLTELPSAHNLGPLLLTKAWVHYWNVHY